jgi:pimeloyl-ACP methyl ester carboxylesterase
MPFVRVPRNWRAAADGAGDAGSDTIEIYYEVHGEDDNGGGGGDGGGDARAGGPSNGGSGPAPQHGGDGADGGSEECESEGTRVTGATRSRPARVLLIMGVAAASRAWAPQFTLFDGSSSARQCIAVDNRGIGRSGSPSRASDYSTEFMARDAIAALAAAGWDAPGERIHIVGHSMGGMIACKVAALLGAERVASLMPISSSLGGGSAFFLPPLDFLLGAAGKMISSYSLMPARKARAKFDLWVHYTDDWLTHRVDHPDEVMHEDGDDGGANDRRAGLHADADSPANEEAPKPLSPSRQSLLREEYIEASANGGEQCQAGLEGQLHAVHSHRMSRREVRALCLSLARTNGAILCADCVRVTLHICFRTAYQRCSCAQSIKRRTPSSWCTACKISWPSRLPAERWRTGWASVQSSSLSQVRQWRFNTKSRVA